MLRQIKQKFFTTGQQLFHSLQVGIWISILSWSLGLITLWPGSVAQALPLSSSVPIHLARIGSPLPQQGSDLESNFVTNAVDQAEAAVVQVNVSRNLGGEVPDVLKPFLGGPGAATTPSRVLRGLGSGFVINASGQILTNAHVVDQADTVTVSFQDGRILPGKVLGKDPVTDVAVIQVQASDLPTVTIGDSDKVRQGQWAIAIGNPLGLQETVTVGVISGTERSSVDIGIPDKRVGFLQTDAAINPGNSGGPLLNARGEVVGINTAILQGSQGLGFAIPINVAQRVAQQLIMQGFVEHPYIGIQMVTLNSQVKAQINAVPNSNFRVDEDEGILVVQVGRGSPAAKAGLRAGDVIHQVNDTPVNNAIALQRALDEVGVGGKLAVELHRGSRAATLTLQPEQLPTLDQ